MNVVAGVSEQRLKHLEFIQAMITRMAGNSMAAKSWSVALTSALVGLATAQTANPRFVILALVPPVVFWAIDGYYLYLERCYRDRFDEVRHVKDEEWKGFEMEPLKAKRCYVLDGLLRPSVWAVHLLIVILGGAAWSMAR
jgi:hypothetical protein